MIEELNAYKSAHINREPSQNKLKISLKYPFEIICMGNEAHPGCHTGRTFPLKVSYIRVQSQCTIIMPSSFGAKIVITRTGNSISSLLEIQSAHRESVQTWKPLGVRTEIVC